MRAFVHFAVVESLHSDLHSRSAQRTMTRHHIQVRMCTCAHMRMRACARAPRATRSDHSITVAVLPLLPCDLIFSLPYCLPGLVARSLNIRPLAPYDCLPEHPSVHLPRMTASLNIRPYIHPSVRPVRPRSFSCVRLVPWPCSMQMMAALFRHTGERMRFTNMAGCASCSSANRWRTV
jgi:hypothetical protein